MPDPQPMAVIDVADPSYGRLNSDRQAYAKFRRWLESERLDPDALRKIEVYDSGSPFPQTRVWGRVFTSASEPAEVPLSTIPPVHVLCIPGIWRTWPAETWPSEVWAEGQAP